MVLYTTFSSSSLVTAAVLRRCRPLADVEPPEQVAVLRSEEHIVVDGHKVLVQLRLLLEDNIAQHTAEVAC